MPDDNNQRKTDEAGADAEIVRLADELGCPISISLTIPNKE